MNAPALVAHVAPEPTRADILTALHELEASLVRLSAAHLGGAVHNA